MAETVIKARNLSKHFPVESGLLSRLLGEQRSIHAVDGVDFELRRGEIFGIAGESGCGKTTTGECIVRLLEPTDGEILFGDQENNIADLTDEELKEYRRSVQMVFQDPYESINDRFTVGKWVREPLIIHDIGSSSEQREKVKDALEQSGLRPPENFLNQFPHELSGGQRQRVALARALVLDPDVIVADEPTSMLDVSVRAGVLNIFKQLAEEQDVAILYISHDLSLLRYICNQIGIMYQGEFVEIGESDSVLQNPKHPYTQSLLRAVPHTDPLQDRERVNIPGEVKERVGGVKGCPFKERCEYRFERCNEDPGVHTMEEETGQQVACHLYDEKEDRPLPQYSR